MPRWRSPDWSMSRVLGGQVRPADGTSLWPRKAASVLAACVSASCAPMLASAPLDATVGA
jgi:hypothetical protein